MGVLELERQTAIDATELPAFSVEHVVPLAESGMKPAKRAMGRSKLNAADAAVGDA